MRTVRALREAGGWKAGTALEIASMPVIAVAPDEKARSTNSTVRPSIGSSVDGRGGREAAAGGIDQADDDQRRTMARTNA